MYVEAQCEMCRKEFANVMYNAAFEGTNARTVAVPEKSTM